MEITATHPSHGTCLFQFCDFANYECNLSKCFLMPIGTWNNIGGMLNLKLRIERHSDVVLIRIDWWRKVEFHNKDCAVLGCACDVNL